MNFEEWLQSRLTAHGFPCGPIDGIIGPITRKAMRAFEKAHGFKEDALADADMVKALRATASAVTPKDAVEIPDRTPAPGHSVRPPAWPQQRDCMRYYGNVGQSQGRLSLPFEMVLAWDKRVKIKSMTLHRKVIPSATRVFNRIATIYSEKERKALGLHLFGGSLNVRKMRGGRSYSMHSWGIAIDFDPERNRLSWHKPKARLSHDDAIPFWVEWEKEGWLSLGRARNFDWMHVQAARL